MANEHKRAVKRGWVGDLDDDCNLSRYGYMACVEKMDRGHWWVGVYRIHEDDKAQSLFNSADMMTECRIPTGTAARAAAELLLECLRMHKL